MQPALQGRFSAQIGRPFGLSAPPCPTPPGLPGLMHMVLWSTGQSQSARQGWHSAQTGSAVLSVEGSGILAFPVELVFGA